MVRLVVVAWVVVVVVVEIVEVVVVGTVAVVVSVAKVTGGVMLSSTSRSVSVSSAFSSPDKATNIHIIQQQVLGVLDGGWLLGCRQAHGYNNKMIFITKKIQKCI